MRSVRRGNFLRDSHIAVIGLRVADASPDVLTFVATMGG